MADKLGPGSYAGTQLAIDTLILEMSDLELQRLMNSENTQLLHKQSSNDTAKIQKKYGNEIQYVRNELKNCDKGGDEYKDLMTELESLEDERDSAEKAVETQTEIKESDLETENVSLEARYEAAKTDKESLEQMQENNIKNNS